MSDRLKSAMAARKITVADLLGRTEISKAGLYFILDGTTNPEKVRFQTIHDICKALRISTDWLMFGFGDMDAGRVDLPSQGLRIDADTIRDAQDALRAIAQVQGLPAAEMPDWVNDPERLALAIEAVLSVVNTGNGPSNIIDLMAKISERMRGNAVKQGTDGNSNKASNRKLGSKGKD
jgi:DNA-binding Xre family transcriptional regulator